MNMTRIKKLRTQLHLSQEYVANYLGLSRSTYTQMENGKRKVLADEVAKLSDLFGVSTDSLLNDTNGMAIEALQVKRGRWKEHGVATAGMCLKDSIECSVCGYLSCKHDHPARKNYCPNCGAKMDKEEEE